MKEGRFFFHLMKGDGSFFIGAGGIESKSVLEDPARYKWSDEIVAEHSYFSGKVLIKGGTVTTDRLGSSTDDALNGNKKGTIEFSGGTVSVHNAPVSAAAVGKAVTKAGGDKKYVTKIVLGKKVRKIRTVKVKVGKKATNKKYVKKYRKIFTKKITGKKVKVSL